MPRLTGGYRVVSEGNIMPRSPSAVLCLLFVSFLFEKDMFAETILWEERTAHALNLGILISEVEFTDEAALKIAGRILRESGLPFLKVVLLTDAMQRFDSSPVHDGSFEAWARNCSRAVGLPVRVAELTKIKDDSVLRIRDNLTTRRIVLTGQDPLKYRVSDTDFEILHIDFNQRAVFPFVVYARSSGTLRLEDAEELYRRLQARLSTMAISVGVRTDSWFEGLIATCWWGLRSPPDRTTIYRAPEIKCARYTQSPVACIVNTH